MKKYILIRSTGFRPGDTQTMGTMEVEGKTIYTLEPPWLDNEKFVSCIPVGEYIVHKRTSPKFGDCFKVASIGKQEVHGRSDILIHAGNLVENTTGCILVGLQSGHVNMDGKPDVLGSRAALRYMLDETEYNFYLEIKNEETNI